MPHKSKPKPKKKPRISTSKETLFTLKNIDKRLKSIEDLVMRIYTRSGYRY